MRYSLSPAPQQAALDAERRRIVEEEIAALRGRLPGATVELRDDGVSFSSLAVPDGLELPAPELAPMENGLRFHAGDAEDRIDVRIAERRCIDSMSGSHFELTATVIRGDSELRGCAVRGPLSR